MQQGFGLVDWELRFINQARKDAKKLALSGLKKNARELLDIVKNNPFQNPPPYEKLTGDLAGAYSHRINIKPKGYSIMPAITAKPAGRPPATGHWRLILPLTADLLDILR